MLVNGRACKISENTVSSTNRGIFVHGGGSTGNRITQNVWTGGAVRAAAAWTNNT